jgi:hypothetical protein
LYELTVHAGTWGGGSVTLQRLAADGSTYATALKAFSADWMSVLQNEAKPILIPLLRGEKCLLTSLPS